jgi:prepilin-type N-terminal cleavage/methylation domain-containing protein
MLQKGFTFIELTVAIAVLAVLTTLSTVNLLTVRNRASISSASLTLLADIRAQQIKSISGDTEGSGVSSNHGIYISQNSYTLFRGNSYSQNNPTNFTITLESPLTLVTTFPSSQIIFSVGSGDVTSYNASSDTVVVSNPTTAETSTIELNRYGVFTQFN